MEKAEEQERTERNWVKDEQEKAFQVRRQGRGKEAILLGGNLRRESVLR